LSAAASGTGLTYQWSLNGGVIAGATGSTYTIGSFSSANAGVYSVTVTNSLGSATATIATLSGGTARLLNLSARSAISAGSVLTAGFVIGGQGTKTVLLRGIGPALTAFGVPEALPDPQLTLLNGSGILAQNTAWGGAPALAAAFTLTGAFALAPGSSDDALLATGLTAGAYSSRVGSASGGAGAALNEIYEADGAASSARLLNLSVLAPVAPGSPLVGGFVIGGSAPSTEEVLVRGIGPALANFGVGGALSNPVLTVYDGTGATIASNAGWTSGGTVTAAQLTAIFAAVGAFPLTNGSNDAAVVLQLAPGSYSAQISGGGSAAGQALVEIYEVTP
jgi:hypothetical protein